jgi:hypothetical protein
MASGTSKVLQLTACHADPNSARLGRAGFEAQALMTSSTSTNSMRRKIRIGSRFMLKFFKKKKNRKRQKALSILPSKADNFQKK